jgi:hypothetical protein
MTRDELELQSQLQRDADSLCRSANLPTAQQALWRAKVRLARSRSRRVTEVMAYVESAAALLVAAVLIAIAWRNVVASLPEIHRYTLLVVGLTTAIMVAIIAAVPITRRRDYAHRTQA